MGTVAASLGHVTAPLPRGDYDFALPSELIAQEPLPERDQSRLLVLDRKSGARLHSSVHELPSHLQPGDLLVVNDTRVVPARLRGRSASGGAVELLVLRELSPTSALCLGRPTRRLRPEARLSFPGGVTARVGGVAGGGRYVVHFDSRTPVTEVLAADGEVPLPPYIRRPEGPRDVDRVRYQTIFGRTPGAIAAPTAGLHFSERLLAALRQRGVQITAVTLHVGPGTFLPVRVEDFRDHVMEPEWYEISTGTAAAIARARNERRRIVAVGTTTTRALESAAAADGTVVPGNGWARVFITPGYDFRVVQALFTNFHLPGSTLLLLVSALAGRERLLKAYSDAVEQRYRFYSYGDAMLIQ
jgi:S-adenosylmethionine:tRNA ribosyltransferase-isomerase